MGGTCSTRRGVVEALAGMDVAPTQCLAGGKLPPPDNTLPLSQQQEQPRVRNSEDLFQRLDDDVLLHVLSFVSTAPLESFTKTQRFYLHQNEDPLRLSRQYHQQTKQLEQQQQQTKKKPNSKRWFSMALKKEHHKMATSNSPTTTLTRGMSKANDDPDRFGTLTHVLPLVCRRFRDLCVARPLWELVLLRNFQSDDTWKRAAVEIAAEQKITFPISPLSDADDNAAEDTAEELGTDAHNTELLSQSQPQSPSYGTPQELLSAALDCLNNKGGGQYDYNNDNTQHGHRPFTCTAKTTGPELYRQIYARKAVVMPLFRMHSPSVRIGQSTPLHLFERRYRRMILDLVVPFPVFGTDKKHDHSRIVDIPEHARPRFLWSCLPRVHEGAAVVEIERCRLRADGTADIVVKPIAWTMVDEVTAGDHHGLWYAALARSQQRSTLSVFQMREAGWNTFLRSDRAFALRMFEPRYMRLVYQLLAQQRNFQRESDNHERRPRFVVASTSGTSPAVARVVEMEDCQMRLGGCADLVVAPTEWVLVESMTKQRSDGLYQAQVAHMRTPSHHYHYGGFGAPEDDDDV